MQSKIRLFGHPMHPMLVVFPLGLLVAAISFDIIFLITRTPLFSTIAYWMIISGVIGGLLAASVGFLDWLVTIPSGTRAKTIGAIHGCGNLVVVLSFIGSAVLRTIAESPSAFSAPGSMSIGYPGPWAYVLSFLGALIALVTGWLGGELVDRFGIGVSAAVAADANAAASKPASAT